MTDAQLDQQTEEHLLSQEEGDEDLSNCCQAMIYEDSDICSACKEHCITMEEEYLLMLAEQSIRNNNAH